MIAIDNGMIARWKIDTPFENYLAQKADNSEIWKNIYCFYYRVFDCKYYKKGVEIIKKLVEAKGVKLSKPLLRDMIYSLHRFGFSFDEYFSLSLYAKNAQGRSEFISDKIRYEYYCMLNSKEGIKLLSDKGKTYEILKDAFKRDCVAVYSEKDLEAFDDFVKKHNKFIYKPMTLDCGRGIKIIDVLNNGDCTFEKLMSSGPFILEELVVQSKELAAFHSSSVNTVRVPTVRCADGVHIFSPFFRMGRGNSIVDNAGAGGIFAAVDAKTGIVISRAVAEYREETHIKHPDTDKQIIGYQLPQWDEAIEMVKTLALRFPETRYIGWDIAHTEKGWVVIEGNSCGQFVAQIAEKVGRREEFVNLIKNK